MHVLRNSLIPAVTAAGPLLGFLVTGSFIIENIFAIPGIGRYYVTSVSGRDYSTVMGITVLLAILIIVANLVVDILYGYLDPRTRDQRHVDGPRTRRKRRCARPSSAARARSGRFEAGARFASRACGATRCAASRTTAPHSSRWSRS